MAGDDPPKDEVTKLQPFFEMLKTDFDNIYKVNLKAVDERLSVLKLSLSFYSAPFIVLAALLSAKVISPCELSSLKTIPSYMFAFTLICGLANIIPLFRFIEATGTHMRTARSINNFRSLYAIKLQDFLEKVDWEVHLPVERDYPRTFEIFSWTGVNVFFMAILNSFYITLGLFGTYQKNPLSGEGIIIFLISSGLQYLIYYLKGRKSKNQEVEK